MTQEAKTCHGATDVLPTHTWNLKRASSVVVPSRISIY